MLDTYRAVFRARGSAAFCSAAFVMRLPMAIYPIGLVLIASARNGHYGFAGLLSGIYVIANGIGNPALARVTDRLGQRRTLIPASVLHAVAVAVLAVSIVADWPDWTLLAPTAIAGFSFLAISSLVRARWTFVLGERAELSTAYSLESTLDEVIFVVGPLIATLVATQIRPVAVLYVAALFVLVGAVWLSPQHATEPPPHPVTAVRRRSALAEPGMPLLIAVTLALGMIFASVEVTMVAFCGQHGHRGLSGAVLACFALGSATAGFIYGSRHWRADLLTRFRGQALVFSVLPLVFLAAVNISVLAICAFVAGLGIAPTLITLYGLIERIVPAASLTEGLAWLVTGISVGYGAGSATVGAIADAHGARAAFLVSIAGGLLLGVLAEALYRQLSRRAAALHSESALSRSS